MAAGVGTLLFMAIIVGNLIGGPSAHFKNNNPTNGTQPTSTTQPPAPQPATPPRAFRGLSVDTSSESYPKSYLPGVAESDVTTVGYSEARSISDDDNQIM